MAGANNRDLVGISGIGIYIPQTAIDTKVIAEENNLPNEIYEKIGVRTIYKSDDDENPSDMAIEAANLALNDARLNPLDLDLIISVGFFKDYHNWQMAPLIKNKLNAVNSEVLDMWGGCAGFFQATELAVRQIWADKNIDTVLITCGEKFFGYGWPTFLSSGAQSIVLTRSCPQFNFIDFASTNLIKHHKMGVIPNGGTKNPFDKKTAWKGNWMNNLEMDASVYYDHIKPIMIPRFKDVVTTLLKRTGYSLEDLDYMVTLNQQVDFPDKILKEIGRPDMPAAKEYNAHYGHFSGGDNYLVLDLARKDNKIKKGDLILNVGIGGIAWFASLIKY